jgi:hypothetical protein
MYVYWSIGFPVPTKFEFQRGSKNTKNANGKAAGRLFCERARNLLDNEIKIGAFFSGFL